MKRQLKLGEMIRFCSGVKRHAWFHSKIGPARKWAGANLDSPIFHYTFWEKIMLFLKSLFKLK